MTDKEVILKQINSGMKCDKSCIGHRLYTHNLCMTCNALKDSPYHQEYLKDKTDEEIANDIIQGIEEFENDQRSNNDRRCECCRV